WFTNSLTIYGWPVYQLSSWFTKLIIYQFGLVKQSAPRHRESSSVPGPDVTYSRTARRNGANRGSTGFENVRKNMMSRGPELRLLRVGLGNLLLFGRLLIVFRFMHSYGFLKPPSPERVEQQDGSSRPVRRRPADGSVRMPAFFGAWGGPGGAAFCYSLSR